MPTTHLRRTRQPQTGPHTQRVPIAKWIDPYQGIQGSSIEKMVMAEFVRRGIYFEHTPQKNSLGGGVDPTWEADFLLPQYHIWLEIQGGYFHTLPGAPERDALRFATIEAAHWKPIFWWEDDIRTRLQDIMNDVPEFYRVEKKLNTSKAWRRSGNLPFFQGGMATNRDGKDYTKGSRIDHLKGLRKALSARAKPPQRLKKKKRLKRTPK